MTSMSETDDGKMVVTCSATPLTSFAVLVDVAGSLSVSWRGWVGEGEEE